jgi:hypothetical protein
MHIQMMLRENASLMSVTWTDKSSRLMEGVMLVQIISMQMQLKGHVLKTPVPSTFKS